MRGHWKVQEQFCIPQAVTCLNTYGIQEALSTTIINTPNEKISNVVCSSSNVPHVDFPPVYICVEA